MLVTLITLAVFLVSFISLGFTYIMLVNLKLLKKKRLEKVVRLIGVYSLLLALIYVFQHKFM